MTLYVITPDSPMSGSQLCEAVEEALVGGAGMVQYRDKHRPFEERRKTGRALVALCRSFGVPLIANDSVALALEINADGVHLGASDGTVNDARKALGKRAIIGVTCYGEIARGHAAELEGATYAAFGACFPSRTKPSAGIIPSELIRSAHESLGIDVCGIGGIVAENVGSLMEAGADLIAVCSAVFEGPSVRTQTRAFVTAMRRSIAPRAPLPTENSI